MRSAPLASFFRHSGLRMIVLAVNERRSPAESTNGNSALAPGAGSVASESSSSKSSGIASWMRRFGVCTRAKLSSHSSTAKTTALLLVSSASKSASPASPGSPPKPARASDFGLALRRDLAEPPDGRGLGEALGQQIADRAVEQRPARSPSSAGFAPTSSKNFARKACGPRPRRARSAATASAGSAPSASTSRAWSSASEKSPGSGGISARRRWK